MTSGAGLTTRIGALMLITGAGGCAPNGRALHAGVRDTLDRQAEAWNAGDIRDLPVAGDASLRDFPDRFANALHTCSRIHVP